MSLKTGERMGIKCHVLNGEITCVPLGYVLGLKLLGWFWTLEEKEVEKFADENNEGSKNEGSVWRSAGEEFSLEKLTVRWQVKFHAGECEVMHMRKINSNFSKLVIGAQERNIFYKFLWRGTKNSNWMNRMGNKTESTAVLLGTSTRYLFSSVLFSAQKMWRRMVNMVKDMEWLQCEE